jgi:hypothetical protein
VSKKPKYKTRSVKAGQTPNIPGSHQTRVAKNKVKGRYNFFKENRGQLAVLFLLAMGLYIQTLSYDYVLDDTVLIVKNKFTQKGIAGIPEIVGNETFKGHFGDQKELVEGGRYRPFSQVTFAIEKTITGGNAAFSHFINVLLYAFTGIFLYRVLLLLFPQAGKQFLDVPFAATALFIVHPLHVEVIANVKGRDEIFAFLAELGILYYSFKWLAQNKTRYLVYSALCFFLGILSKARSRSAWVAITRA